MATSTTGARSLGAVETRRTVTVHGARHFVHHLGEMLLAMVIGMIVLGMLDRGILAAAGTSASHVRDTAPELVAVVMASNMSAGMAVWMRHRGHAWARIAEMAGAMFVPALAAIALFWGGVIQSGAILALEHVAMIPAMIAVVLVHRGEYSQPVHQHAVG
jgi:flagellar biosynthetic protein FliP